MRKKMVPSIGVFGCLSTNEIVYVDSIVQAGNVTYTNNTSYIAGGHGTNTARMIKTLLPENHVYYASKTTNDLHNLWTYPYEALRNLNVNTKYINILSQSSYQPNRVIVQVEKKTGHKAYIVMPGVIDTFKPNEIDYYEDLFLKIKSTNGIIFSSFEIPVDTSIHIIQKANVYNIPVFLDMGGIFADFNMELLAKCKIFLLKPNRYETKILTGIDVVDERSAKAAGSKLLKDTIENVLITAGANGAYLMSRKIFLHIPIPHLKFKGGKNGTGCGDQVIATLAAKILQGDNIVTAVKKAVLAGTLQLYKSGIDPILSSELQNAIKKYL